MDGGRDRDGWQGRAARARRQVAASLAPTRRRLASQDLMLLAAALTFYAGIALIPLLLVAVFLAGSLVGHDRVQELAADLAEIAPDGLGFSARLLDLVEAGSALSAIAVLAALIPATTYGEGLLRAFDRFAGTGARGKGVIGRLRAIPLLAVLPLLVLAGLAAVAVLPDLLGVGTGATLLGVYLTFWIAWLGGAGLLAVTFRAFSPVPLERWAVLWGSLGTGSFLAGMSLGWVLVLEVGLEVGRAYGGSEELGAAVMLAVYLYLVQVACLVGYAWVLVLSERRTGQAAQP